jgi:hypothetical protein
MCEKMSIDASVARKNQKLGIVIEFKKTKWIEKNLMHSNSFLCDNFEVFEHAIYKIA